MEKKAKWLVVLVVMGVVIVFLGQVSDNATDIEQARAAIEAARAAQGAAKAAEVAGRGLASTSVTLAFILGGIVFSALAIIALTIYLNLSGRKAAQGGKGAWVSGPNAQFRRTDVEKKYAPLPPGDPINQLMQLLVLQQLGQMQKPAPRQEIEMLGPVDDEGEDYLWR